MGRKRTGLSTSRPRSCRLPPAFLVKAQLGQNNAAMKTLEQFNSLVQKGDYRAVADFGRRSGYTEDQISQYVEDTGKMEAGQVSRGEYGPVAMTKERMRGFLRSYDTQGVAQNATSDWSGMSAVDEAALTRILGSGNFAKARVYGAVFGYTPDQIARFAERGGYIEEPIAAPTLPTVTAPEPTTGPTDAQKERFADLMQDCDYLGAAQYARGLGFSNPAIAQYIVATGMTVDGVMLTESAMLAWLDAHP